MKVGCEAGHHLIERRNLDVEGKSVSYLESGSNYDRPLIALHAWPMCSTIYKPLMQQLTNYWILAPDFPGFGDSDMLDGDHTYDAFADFTLKFMDKKGIEKADILGVSFGAGVGMVIAKNAPERVGYVVLNSPPVYFEPHLSKLQKKVLSLSDKHTKLKGILFNGLINGDNFVFRILWGVKADFSEEPYQSIFLQARKMKFKAVDDTLHEIINTDFRGILSEIRVPTLLLIGSEDKDFKPDFELARGGISFACSAHILESGDHIMVATKAAEFATVVSQFLNE